jgi:hypothetical protein
MLAAFSVWLVATAFLQAPNDTTKGSHQLVYYAPTTVFKGDGLLMTSSYAAAIHSRY